MENPASSQPFPDESVTNYPIGPFIDPDNVPDTPVLPRGITDDTGILTPEEVANSTIISEWLCSKEEMAAIRAKDARSARDIARFFDRQPAAYQAMLARECYPKDKYAEKTHASIENEIPPILKPGAVLHLSPPPWLVADTIPQGALCFLYGREGVGKSFAALSVAYSVATGTPFLGHACTQGPVIYITAEGIWSLGTRVRGLVETNGASANSYDIPLYLVPDAPQLNTPDGRSRFCLMLRSLLPDEPKLIIIDTFHACMATADENSAKDVGALLQFIGEIRRYTHCTFIIIHHAGKSSGTYRGHSSMAGGADTMIRASLDNAGDLLFTCEKQKDSAPFPDLHARLKPVTLTQQPGETEPATSCLLEPIASSQPKHLVVLSVLQSGKRLTYTQWQKACEASGVKKETFDASRRRLTKAGGPVVKFDDGTYSPVALPEAA